MLWLLTKTSRVTDSHSSRLGLFFLLKEKRNASVGSRERLNQREECDGSWLIIHLAETDLQQVCRQEWHAVVVKDTSAGLYFSKFLLENTVS